MLHIVLYEPGIPANTGNIIRLCANTGAQLHLIEPLGFALDDKKLRRAGLDYHEFADILTYGDYRHFCQEARPQRLLALTTRAQRSYTEISYDQDDYLLFGPETRGLPEAVLHALGGQCCLRIPMQASSRSLNLSNAAAIVVYEAWRQLGFPGGGESCR